jgi:hypothetical protein
VSSGEWREELNRLYPKRGPCAICGGPDARHRLWDSIDGYLRVGEPLDFIMDDFSVTKEQVEAVQRAYRKARKARRPLPGRYPL